MARQRATGPQRRIIAERAAGRCEYCKTPADYAPDTFSVEHIIPSCRGGGTDLENLAMSCLGCNNAKASHIRGTDPVSGRVVRLFHPRHREWKRHFRWSADFGTITGRTAVGRATVAALEMNHARVVQIRLLWAVLGLHPPE